MNTVLESLINEREKYKLMLSDIQQKITEEKKNISDERKKVDDKNKREYQTNKINELINKNNMLIGMLSLVMNDKGLSYSHIANKLDVSEDTVSRRMNMLIRMLERKNDYHNYIISCPHCGHLHDLENIIVTEALDLIG